MQSLLDICRENPVMVTTIATILGTASYFWFISSSSSSSSSSHSWGYTLVRTVLEWSQRKRVLTHMDEFYHRLRTDRTTSNSVPSFWNRRLLQINDITNAKDIFGPYLPFAFTRIFTAIPNRCSVPSSSSSSSPVDQSATPVKGTLVYIHGGCYTFTSTEYHWDFVTKIITALDYRLVFIQYPLAPESTVENTLNVCEKIITAVLEYYSVGPVCIMGDSAGGGLSLSVCQRFASSSSTLLSSQQYQRIRSLVLISPWLDVRLTHPLLTTTVPYDPMLDIPGLQEAGKLYAGIRTPDYYRYYDKFYQQQKQYDPSKFPTDIVTIDENDPTQITRIQTLMNSPFVNPLDGDFTNLPPNITLLIGTYDIFIHDCRKFETKYKETIHSTDRTTETIRNEYETTVRTTTKKSTRTNGQQTLRYVEGNELFHVYPILPFMEEATLATNHIIEYLREDMMNS